MCVCVWWLQTSPHANATSTPNIKLSKDNHLISQHPSCVRDSILSWCLQKVANSNTFTCKMKKKSLNGRHTNEESRYGVKYSWMHLHVLNCKSQRMNGNQPFLNLKLSDFIAIYCLYVRVCESMRAFSGTALCIQLSHQSHVKLSLKI